MIRSALSTTLARRRLFPLAYLALTLPLVLFLAAVTPYGGAPDEIAHAMRAESLSSGQLLAHRGPQILASGAVQTSSGVDVDQGITAVPEVIYPNMHFTAADLTRAAEANWTHTRVYVQITPIAVYFPVFYVPAAIGIIGAKLAGAGPFTAFLAARLVNVAAFAAIAVAALLVACRGQGLLFCVLSLPMTVSLAASVNPDGLLIASAALAVALLTRTEDPSNGGTSAPAAGVGCGRIGAAVVIGLISLAKFPYAALAALLLLPVQSLDRRLLARLGVAAVAIVPGTLWIAFAMTYLSSPVGPITPTPEYSPGPLWPGPAGVLFHGADALGQLRVLLASPLSILTLSWDAITQDPWTLRSMIGVLGFLSIPLPDPFYLVWKIALVSAGIGGAFSAAGKWAARVRPADALIVAITVCLGVVAVCMSQYLVWTPVGATRVLGTTGRYFLPFLPAVVLAIPTLQGPRLGGVRGLLFVPACTAAFLGLLEVPQAIIQGFYLH